MSTRRTSSSSSASSDAGPEEVRSPQKLQRSIWNQMMPPASNPGHSSPSSSAISLRGLDLTLPTTLPSVLLHCQPHAPHITSLNVSYSIVGTDTLPRLLSSLPQLEELLAVNCGLEDFDTDLYWPEKLRVVDLSRNKLHCFPAGMHRLLFLEKVNLSGNLIREVDPLILKLPNLHKIYLLNNPVTNVPKVICREGVQKMRQYFQVEPLPFPSSDLNCDVSPTTRPAPIHRVRVLRHSESTAESGYDSCSRVISTSTSCSSLQDFGNTEDQEVGEDTTKMWPQFSREDLPVGYTGVCKESLCQVYLPEGCGQQVFIEVVKDVSLYPSTKQNEVLITPVVQISPHGLSFDLDSPAVVVLSHCTRPSGGDHRLVVVCSNTAPHHPPRWQRMESTDCRVFQDCVVFTTTHFSLFAVVLVRPYPTATTPVCPINGGTLIISEFPGFSVHFPTNCIDSLSPSTVQATMYYADSPYCPQDPSVAQASACIGLEPHGMKFIAPVQITLPIPDYSSIVSSFHGAHLQLWYSPCTGDGAYDWQVVEDAAISIRNEGQDSYTATFNVSHFSLFELVWAVCRETVMRLGYGAGFVYRHLSGGASYVSVRCQVFMSPPLPDLSFGLLVVVYRFGEPLSDLSNYQWLLADTGSKHVFLRTGEISVALSGHFSPRSDLGEADDLRREAMIDFSGQDFCLRFEFALRLSEGIALPLCDHQLLGKLRVGPPTGSAPIDLNLIKPSGTAMMGSSDSLCLTPSQPTPSYMDCTPPWTPDHDITLPDNYTLITGDTPLSNRRPGKRRHAHDNPSFGASRAVKAKRRLLVKEGQLDGDKFLMEVARVVGPKWEELGIALGLDFGTLKSVVIDTSSRPEHMKAFYALQEWKHRACDDFTYARLASALEEAGMHSCAQSFCYYQAETDHTHED